MAKAKEKPKHLGAGKGSAEGYDELEKRQKAAELARDGRYNAEKKLEKTDTDANLLIGLQLPPRMGRGKPTNETREAWLGLVETLVGRGVDSPQRLQRVLGVAFVTANKWLEEVYQRWQHKTTPQELNLRRAALYSEAAEVAREAMRSAMSQRDPEVRAKLLKVVLDANKRKAALYGLDTTKVEIDAKVTNVNGDLTPEEFMAKYGVDPRDVVAVGRLAAKGLSKASQATVEAQLADEREEAEAVLADDAAAQGGG